MWRTKSPIRRWLIAVVVLGALAVPFAGWRRSIQIPGATINRIIVTDNATTSTLVITDATQIQKSIAFIQGQRQGWSKTWDTFPTPQYHVMYESSGNFQYVVWMGRDGTSWIGYRAGGETSTNNVLKKVSAAERKELLRDLGF